MNAYCHGKDNTCWDKCKLLLIMCTTIKACYMIVRMVVLTPDAISVLYRYFTEIRDLWLYWINKCKHSGTIIGLYVHAC